MPHSQTMLILALVLGNAGVSTASSSHVRRVMVRADGVIEPQLPEDASLSLTELVDMLPEEGTELTQRLLQLAEEGTPSDEILKIVRAEKEKIKPFKAEATATLNSAMDPVRRCATSMDGDMEHSQTKKNECSVMSTSHTSQRTKESNMFVIMLDWKAKTAEKKEVMDTECKIFDDVKAEARAAKASFGGGDVQVYLQGTIHEFCDDLLPRYKDAKEKCTTAKHNYENVLAKYEAATAAYKVQVKAANVIQTKLDVTCCVYALATKRACDSYDTCYEEKLADYELEEKGVNAQLKVKKVEWRVLMRIECLLPLLNTDDTAGIEACRDIVEHSTVHLEPDYPDTPRKSSCTPEPAYPGTDAYYNAHYVPLPDNAKGEPVANCVGMTSPTAQACHWESVNKENADIDYTGKETITHATSWTDCKDQCLAMVEDNPPCRGWVMMSRGAGSCYQKYDMGAGVTWGNHWGPRAHAGLFTRVCDREAAPTTYAVTFSGNDMDGWDCGGIQTCGSLGEICGGKGHKGKGSSIQRSVDLAAGTYTLTLDFIKVDSWDGEEGQVYVNGNKCWASGPLRYHEGSQQCGQGHHNWFEKKLPVVCSDIKVNAGEPLTIKVTSTLNQASNDESYAISNVKISPQ